MTVVATDRPANPAAVKPAFLTSDDWEMVVKLHQLSPQQARIVGLILQGKQDKEIAAEMELDRSTIKTYLRRVFDRVGVEDRMELVLRVFAVCVKAYREARVSPLVLSPSWATCGA